MSVASLSMARAPSAFPALVTLALAILVTGLPILAHLVAQPIGIAICVILAALVAHFAASMLPAILVFSYLFQNLLVSMRSPAIVELTDFNAIRGYNFLLTATVWLVVVSHYWIDRASFDRRFRAVMNASTCVLALIAIYFAIGFLSDPSNAAIYLRNVAAPFMLFDIFAVVAVRFRLTIHATFMAMAFALVAYGYAELLFHNSWLKLVNGDAYLHLLSKRQHDAGVWVKDMQETGRVLRSDFDILATTFLNTPLLGDLGTALSKLLGQNFPRLLGPNFHSISFAYALGFFGLISIVTGGVIYWLLSLPLLILVGSKGAIVMVLFTVAGFAGTRIFGRKWVIWPLLAVLVAYAVVGIMVGIEARDYHVIGFVGGVQEFLRHPLGHGLGAGGNLSHEGPIDWARSQGQGHTDIAVESAVGVLLAQMGLAGFFLLGRIAWIARQTWKVHLQGGDRLSGVTGLGLMAVLVNGIFQEEALFSPLAAGMTMALAGLVLGRSLRPKIVT